MDIRVGILLFALTGICGMKACKIQKTGQDFRLGKLETVEYRGVKIEKCYWCDAHAFMLHFPHAATVAKLDKNIPGVELISSHGKHQVLVRVGLAFDQLAVLKKVIDSHYKKV